MCMACSDCACVDSTFAVKTDLYVKRVLRSHGDNAINKMANRFGWVQSSIRGVQLFACRAHDKSNQFSSQIYSLAIDILRTNRLHFEVAGISWKFLLWHVGLPFSPNEQKYCVDFGEYFERAEFVFIENTLILFEAIPEIFWQSI